MHFSLKWWWGWVILSSVQSLSHVWLFVTPWTAAHLSITNSWSMQWWHPTISTSVIPFTSYLQSSPASWSFPKSQFFESGGQNIGASASVLPMNIQDWFPLGLTVWSPWSPRDSQESSPTPQFRSINSSVLSFFMVQLSHPYMDWWKNHSFDYMDLCQ